MNMFLVLTYHIELHETNVKPFPEVILWDHMYLKPLRQFYHLIVSVVSLHS